MRYLVNVLLPVDFIVKAIARKYSIRLQYPGAYAANCLGLSTQVPAKIVYLTDGMSRTVMVGKQTIIFEKNCVEVYVPAIGALVIQALRYLGKHCVNDVTIRMLQRKLSPGDKRRLLCDISCARDGFSDNQRKISVSVNFARGRVLFDYYWYCRRWDTRSVPCARYYPENLQ